jgi:hypothetical protein
MQKDEWMIRAQIIKVRNGVRIIKRLTMRRGEKPIQLPFVDVITSTSYSE